MEDCTAELAILKGGIGEIKMKCGRHVTTFYLRLIICYRLLELSTVEGGIATLKGRTASLRFTLRNGQFYSYWLE